MLVSKKESELFSRAYEEEEEEKAREQGSPLLRTNPGIWGLIWLQPTLKMQPHDGIGKFSVNLYLYGEVCAFPFEGCCSQLFLGTDLRVEFHSPALCKLNGLWALS